MVPNTSHHDFQVGDTWDVTYFEKSDDFRITLQSGGDDSVTLEVIPPDQFLALFKAITAALEERADALIARQDDLEGEVCDLEMRAESLAEDLAVVSAV